MIKLGKLILSMFMPLTKCTISGLSVFPQGSIRHRFWYPIAGIKNNPIIVKMIFVIEGFMKSNNFIFS